MNGTLWLALMALSHNGAHGGSPDDREALMCPAQVVATFDALDDAMRRLAMDVEGAKKGKERLREDMRAALARSADARRVACRAARDDGPDVIVVQPPPTPMVVVLDEPRQRELVTVVRREAFDAGRLSALELGMQGACITSAQAKELVQELTFSQPRINAVRILAPHIVDRDRSALVLESLTFDSDRKAAREILMTTTTAPQCVVRRL